MNEIVKMKLNSIQTFYYSDKSFIINHNFHRLVCVNINIIDKEHVGRVWNVMMTNKKYNQYLQSDIIEE